MIFKDLQRLMGRLQSFIAAGVGFGLCRDDVVSKAKF